MNVVLENLIHITNTFRLINNFTGKKNPREQTYTL